MSADTSVNLARRLAAVALVLAGGGCASGAWTHVDGVSMIQGRPPEVPAHRAVELVTLHVHGHEFEFVGYRSCDPAVREVRAQLLLDSGLSALDVAVHAEKDERIAGSPFEAIPNFATTAMSDLRRTWGSRSVFCAVPAAGLHFGNWHMLLGNVTDGHRALPAFALADGSSAAVEPRTYPSNDPLRVTLLDRDLVPEATIAYSDFDADGVPREIHLVDLRDHHTLDVEVEEVHLVAKPAAEPAK